MTNFLEITINTIPAIMKGIDKICPVLSPANEMNSSPCDSLRNSTKNRMDHRTVKNNPNNKPCWYFLFVKLYKNHNNPKSKKYPTASNN